MTTTNPWIDLTDKLNWGKWLLAMSTCRNESHRLTRGELHFLEQMEEITGFMKQEAKITRKQFEWLRLIAQEIQENQR